MQIDEPGNLTPVIPICHSLRHHVASRIEGLRLRNLQLIHTVKIFNQPVFKT